MGADVIAVNAAKVGDDDGVLDEFGEEVARLRRRGRRLERLQPPGTRQQ